MLSQRYSRLFQQTLIEDVAIQMVDFFKIFDEWQCGLNQLKQFFSVPFS